MNIIDYGFFTVKEPPETGQILLFENEKGEDWYDIRKGLTKWEPANGKFISAIFRAWATVDKDGIVTNVEYDPSRLMPGDRRVIGIDADIRKVRPGMVYKKGKLHEHGSS